MFLLRHPKSGRHLKSKLFNNLKQVFPLEKLNMFGIRILLYSGHGLNARLVKFHLLILLSMQSYCICKDKIFMLKEENGLQWDLNSKHLNKGNI